ncbi:MULTISPECIES: sugar-binding protein [unclassified Crossiella]|uniref:sugar-binding protein n=1 Tax=unclassified Crossiella TaxID=2620835 RepID=UPI001FFF94D5|nr:MULTISPECIES: sugar-binding protein [unclassified Crossiella]MCK2243091.1 PIG-L family deacetylase [Crossiella sp. S99.2]MCK2256968.1 PIG-L family deacetylase [Crossiella sp. S99.1]
MDRRWLTGLLPVAAALITLVALESPATAVDEQAEAARRAVDLDALFVGAHPDDEAFSLSTFGQWHAEHKVRAGVVTITRGEGGGNAAGPEEGPALGQLREAEERRAVRRAGITEVLNLDEADFYYTVSSPLTEQGWQHQDVLGKLVRAIRQTRPELVVTMDPAPTPGNHGNHQYAARLAIEAYRVAADPGAYPEQLREEVLRPWSVKRLLTGGARGERPSGPDCAAKFVPAEATDRVYGVWDGRPSTVPGRSWAQEERSAQREYVTQGWAGFPDVPTDPKLIDCDWFTQVASRVPFSPTANGPDAALHGALIPTPGGLPLGTGAVAEAGRFSLVAGSSVPVKVTVTAPEDRPLTRVEAKLALPAGWQATGYGRLGTVYSGRSASAEFTVTVPAGTKPGRVRIPVELSSGNGSGYTETVVAVVPELTAEQQPLPQVAQFRDWAQRSGVPALADLVPPVLTLPSGGDRELPILVRNNGSATRSGTVTIAPPTGFSATTSLPFTGLAAGATTTLAGKVTNTDTALRTGMQGGDYKYTLSVTGVSSSTPALELVPRSTIPQAPTAPTVDGVATPGEYSGPELDLSTRWEGEDCVSAADCSAKAKLTWHNDTLYALVTVADDKQGSVLDAADCKRHWRTDSLELAIDPRGKSENTSTTLKLAVFPTTTAGKPCAARDADNFQGPAAETVPGLQVASKVSSPYTGYTIELALPLAAVPGALDPAKVGLNLFVYDSDTQDKIGQTRLGWSTWGGVQGDPYRWGRAVFDGYTPPTGRPVDPPAARLPLIALSSVDSAQSVEQSVRTGISLGGKPIAPVWESARLLSARTQGDTVTARVLGAPGKAYVFVLNQDGKLLGRKTIELSHGFSEITVPVTGGRPAQVLLGFETPDGKVSASRVRAGSG